MPSHSAIATTAKGAVEAIQTPTLTPTGEDVRIKVQYASLIAFDTYTSDLGYMVQEYPLVLGFNASGTVAEVGSEVKDLKVGDRVTAFTYGQSRAMQEYTTVPYTAVAKIPDSLTLPAAATIPDNLVTAFFTLFSQLGLPVPKEFPVTSPPANADAAILVYGAGATSGQYAIQLLRAAGYTKILATASPRNHAFIQELGATNVFDYNSPSLAEDVAKVVGGDGKVKYAVDCVSAEQTINTISKLISSGGILAILLPIKEGTSVRGGEGEAMYFEFNQEKTPLPAGTKTKGVRTFTYDQDEFLRLNLMPKIVPSLLDSGIIQPNRVRLQETGTFLERVEAGLDLLRNNKVSGEKVVVKVES